LIKSTLPGGLRQFRKFNHLKKSGTPDRSTQSLCFLPRVSRRDTQLLCEDVAHPARADRARIASARQRIVPLSRRGTLLVPKLVSTFLAKCGVLTHTLDSGTVSCFATATRNGFFTLVNANPKGAVDLAVGLPGRRIGGRTTRCQHPKRKRKRR
jgi:hypothetical protein